MLFETDFASHARNPIIVIRTKINSAHENTSKPLLPGDTHRCQSERNERVFAHVRRHGYRSIGVEPHQQAAKNCSQRSGDGAWSDWNTRKTQDGRIEYQDVRHRNESCGAPQQFRSNIRPVLF